MAVDTNSSSAPLASNTLPAIAVSTSLWLAPAIWIVALCVALYVGWRASAR